MLITSASLALARVNTHAIFKELAQLEQLKIIREFTKGTQHANILLVCSNKDLAAYITKALVALNLPPYAVIPIAFILLETQLAY